MFSPFAEKMSAAEAAQGGAKFFYWAKEPEARTSATMDAMPAKTARRW